MTADLSISVRSRLWMESIKFPFLGRLFHSLTPTNTYSDLALKLVGLKDLIITNEVVINDDFDSDRLEKIASLLKLVEKYIGTSSDKNLIEILNSISISLRAIHEINEIALEKSRYKSLKNNMFEDSSSAILSNINKYK